MYLMQRTELGDRFRVFTIGFLYRCISTKGIGIVGWCVGVLVISLGVLCLLDTPKGSVFIVKWRLEVSSHIFPSHMSRHCVCVSPCTLSLYLSLQVVYQSKKCGFVILYITSTDSAECSDWVATLRQGVCV